MTRQPRPPVGHQAGELSVSQIDHWSETTHLCAATLRRNPLIYILRQGAFGPSKQGPIKYSYGTFILISAAYKSAAGARLKLTITGYNLCRDEFEILFLRSFYRPERNSGVEGRQTALVR